MSCFGSRQAIIQPSLKKLFLLRFISIFREEVGLKYSSLFLAEYGGKILSFRKLVYFYILCFSETHSIINKVRKAETPRKHDGH